MSDTDGADTTELKLQERHKNHIERKAALERKRAIAEKTYAAGEIALLRRAHMARVAGDGAEVCVISRIIRVDAFRGLLALLRSRMRCAMAMTAGDDVGVWRRM